MTKIFASQYPLTDEGWVNFPRDTEMRRHFFPYTDPSEHPAKAWMNQIEELVLYVSEEGETICDPFAGTGTLMIGGMHKRKIVLLELTDTYFSTLELNIIGMKQTVHDIEDWVSIIQGNSAQILPIPDFCDHMIFSPPYPMGLKKKGEMDKTSKDLGYTNAAEYSEGVDNFTNMSEFIYHRKIKLFYKKCFMSIKSGGTMTIIIKDKMERGKRVLNADRTIRDCESIYFVLEDRLKKLAMGGGYSAVNRDAGLQTVTDEDMLVFRRP